MWTRESDSLSHHLGKSVDTQESHVTEWFRTRTQASHPPHWIAHPCTFPYPTLRNASNPEASTQLFPRDPVDVLEAMPLPSVHSLLQGKLGTRQKKESQGIETRRPKSTSSETPSLRTSEQDEDNIGHRMLQRHAISFVSPERTM